MTTVAVIGGTGYAGSNLVAEAARRGHQVISISRKTPDATPESVRHVAVDVTDTAALTDAIGDATVIVSALSPRGDLDGHLVTVDAALADLAQSRGARLIVIGGFSSLSSEPGAPHIIRTDGFVDAIAGLDDDGKAALLSEATQNDDVLVALQERTDDLQWTFVSPGLNFGAHVPGEATGTYRVDDSGVVLADANGVSALGGADLATAVWDFVDNGEHLRKHVAVAY